MRHKQKPDRRKRRRQRRHGQKQYRKASPVVKKAENRKIENHQAKIQKAKKIILVSIIGIMSLMLLYAGHFLLSGSKEAPAEPQTPESQEESPGIDDTPMKPYINPVKYVHRSETINGLEQEIHILEIDPGAPGIRILPVLSHDLIYGFELLSEMAARKKAYAAINGGFFREFGLPSGMVVINGELFSKSTGQYPVFITMDGKAELREINSEVSVEFHRSARTGKTEGDSADGILPVDNVNFPAKGTQTVVYTPVYGLKNRAQTKNITATVENGVVTRIADYTGEADIPDNGMLISFFDIQKYVGIELPIRVGDSVRLVHQPDLTGAVGAYECGSWLVRDGVPVVKNKDAWVGVLTNRDPRTALGIKEDGTVILLVVDGRQPGYSAGFTGKELAEYLISCGAKDAAMLDGGASTEMLVEGGLVSRPSYKGEERPLAGGILILQE